MTERLATFFPPEFTAVAQWIMCTVHILSCRDRIRGWKAWVLILSALPVMIVLNLSHAEQPALIWLVVTVCCLAAMLLYIRLGTRENRAVVITRWCHALMQSEFAAALAWLVNVLLIVNGAVRFPDILMSQVIMAIVYAVVMIPLGMFVFRRYPETDRMLGNNYTVMVSSFIIAVGAYVLSNISFIAPDSIFGIGIGGGVLFVRSVSDFSGMLGLLAIEEFGYAIWLNMNVNALQGLLDRQYEQYKQFKVNNEQMQQVYHDIKHLINYIRSVSSSGKYEDELRNLEETVSNYEAQYDTGNTVLDVVLAGKKMMCKSADITMECYVDGRSMEFLDPVTICSIFGNALDNAFEYELKIDEAEKRLIKVNVFTENRFLVIRISNYCEETVLNSAEDPLTTKTNPEMHGYGIKGIRLAAGKYGGHVSIRQENKWFIVSVLIPIPDRDAQDGDAEKAEGRETR